ncbi:cellulose synthase/poly-beta-1,6-N-acetylglucosamine synthase-like glycosyltransferase [Catalinimonas alkaloidigena]|uniref:cellulose synthase family protein n=1 Tax=Catalinimonas alkaloidigena TaxID=1075417 RepID=UPI002405863B|nr:cellulose synthase family protein [Catalinimonas alkaloidigena]MDF9800074.1 cellulose synthase/poly-beta-1,6-N-acetylglucosamine synthase-like glycosyltransferase [Catalinimonas alkaloidigena]
MEILIAVGYLLCLLFIFLFSIGQLHLTWHYLRRLKEKKTAPDMAMEEWPMVTIQLPVYNELYVIERLIDAVVKISYPRDKLEIQVLDDSTDETVDLIANKVRAYQEQNIDVKHIRRPERKGFKAGALAYGLEKAKGAFIAIFDADFLPSPDFLKKTIPHFINEKVGVVQTRWGHVNKDYSLLTRLQAFGLDGHFTIEQGGRSHAGSFINFNGTGGVWRKACIEDAGGWSDDTLTEDLDLSYRAQMKGWEFTYLEEVEAPAELPILMPAIKSQQFRWNKGAAECARKHLIHIFEEHPKRKIGWVNRIHAIMHLFNSSVFLFLLIGAVLSVPMLFIKQQHPYMNTFFKLGAVFVLGFFSIGLFYWIATSRVIKERKLWYFLKHYPLFLTITMGLSLHNALAVAEGLLGFKSPFLRTPKFNVTNVKEQWKKNIYLHYKVSPLTWLEVLLALYFVFGIVSAFFVADYGMLLFHAMLAIGFAAVALYSFTAPRHA